MNKKLSKIKPHTMIFDHQICKHVSKKFATIIKDEFLCVGVRNNDEYGGSFKFLGFFANYHEAGNFAEDHLGVVSVDFLYRIIEEAKNSLNNIPLE